MRLIDADALEYSRVQIYHPPGIIGGHAAVVMSSVINDAPTIDAVEVVRCRDCKHRGIVCECPMCYTEDSYDDDYGYEYWDVDKTVDDGFCHCGEEMDTEKEDNSDEQE